MSARANVICKWELPRRVAQANYEQLWNRLRKSVGRIFVFTLVLGLVVYVCFKAITPQDLDINWEKKLLGYVSCVSLLLLAWLVQGFIARFSNITYELRESGVFWRSLGGGAHHLAWEIIEGYWLHEDPEYPGLMGIVLKTKHGARTIILPEGEQASAILNVLDDRAQQIASPEPDASVPPAPPLSIRSLAFLWIITFTFGIGIAFVLYVLRRPDLTLPVAALFLFAGPGTLGLLLLRGPQCLRERSSVAYVIVFNMGGCAIFIFSELIFLFHEMARWIEQAP